MRSAQGLYEVWFSNGNGLQTGPRFRFITDARRYIEDHLPDTSCAIRTPLGQWVNIRKAAPRPAAPR